MIFYGIDMLKGTGFETAIKCKYSLILHQMNYRGLVLIDFKRFILLRNTEFLLND